MCEKNLERKVLSPPSNDENDDAIPSDWEKVKSSKKKRRSRKKKKLPLTKICDTCGQDILENEKRDMFMFNDTYHQLQTKEYCEDHERTYGDHKCKPCWCGDCGYLTKYEVIVDWDKKKRHW